MTYIQAFDPFRTYFCVWGQTVIQFHSLTCSCLVLPAPSVEETVISPYTKVNSKWIKDLNVSHETIKLLEKNTGKNLLDINMSNFFMNISLRARETKGKNEQVGLYQAKKLLYSKGHHQ